MLSFLPFTTGFYKLFPFMLSILQFKSKFSLDKTKILSIKGFFCEFMKFWGKNIIF